MNTEIQTANQINQQDQMLSIIEKVALDPNSSVKKLKQLLELKEHIFDKNAEIEFNKAMSLVQSQLPSVLKKSNNPQTHSKYAKLDLIIQTCSPTWTKCGFALSFGTDKSELEKHLGITCIASHSDGFSRSYRWDLPVDDSGIMGKVNKTQIHATASTVSYGRRYLTCMIFNIATQDDDDGTAGNSGIEFINEDQQKDIENIISEVKYPIGRLLFKFSAKSLDKIRLDDYRNAVHYLKSMSVPKEMQVLFNQTFESEKPLDMFLFQDTTNQSGEQWALLKKSFPTEKTINNRKLDDMVSEGSAIFNEIYSEWIVAVHNEDELGQKQHEDFGIFQETGMALLQTRKRANNE